MLSENKGHTMLNVAPVVALLGFRKLSFQEVFDSNDSTGDLQIVLLSASSGLTRFLQKKAKQ